MNNKIEVEAKCLAVGQVQTVGQNGFRKRDVVLVEQGENQRYPTMVAFTLKQDKVDFVSEKDVGKTLKITGYVESREWNGLYFTEVTAVYVARVGAGKNTPEPAEPDAVDYGEVSDDMPF